MTGRTGIMKGKRGEREVINILMLVIKEEVTKRGCHLPQVLRNSFQAAVGGGDLAGIPFLSGEVKYQESFQLETWWKQCCAAAKRGEEPVLFYRRNNVRWRVRMNGCLLLDVVNGHQRRVRTTVDITLDAFLVWFRERVIIAIEKEGWCAVTS